MYIMISYIRVCISVIFQVLLIYEFGLWRTSNEAWQIAKFAKLCKTRKFLLYVAYMYVCTTAQGLMLPMQSDT